jgi:hypothetical protein
MVALLGRLLAGKTYVLAAFLRVFVMVRYGQYNRLNENKNKT